jgi:release factor glutamine methyltransferase
MFDAGAHRVADIGTGGGIIPDIAVLEPRLPYLYASDISADALDVAFLSACDTMLKTAYICCMVISWRPYEPIDILIANLPYVGTDELDEPTSTFALMNHISRSSVALLG